MSNDYYLDLAKQRAQQLEADKAELLAGLARARANGDDYSGTEILQGIANNQQEVRNLHQLHNDYVAAQNPQQVPLSREEWRARPVERMTAAGGLEGARNRKYDAGLDFNEPHLLASYE